MSAVRQHGTTLIAGLVVLGIVGLFGALTNVLFDFDRIARGAVWLVSAFLAAQLARRMLLDLDTSRLCIAAVVMILLALGIEQRRDHEPLEPKILIQLGLTLAGTLAGAFTTRTPARVHPLAATLGAGASTFGAAVLAVGIGLIIDPRSGAGVGVLVGAPIGAALTLALVEMRRRHAAFGLALFFAVLLAAVNYADGPEHAVTNGLIGAFLGLVMGALGAAFGAKLRPRQIAPNLPKARQVD